VVRAFPALCRVRPRNLRSISGFQMVSTRVSAAIDRKTPRKNPGIYAWRGYTPTRLADRRSTLAHLLAGA
jgi:hypothetical protein